MPVVLRALYFSSPCNLLYSSHALMHMSFVRKHPHQNVLAFQYDSSYEYPATHTRFSASPTITSCSLLHRAPRWKTEKKKKTIYHACLWKPHVRYLQNRYRPRRTACNALQSPLVCVSETCLHKPHTTPPIQNCSCTVRTGVFEKLEYSFYTCHRWSFASKPRFDVLCQSPTWSSLHV